MKYRHGSLVSEMLISLLEGCKLRAYQDQAGVWTCGYGTTGPDVTEKTVFTKQQAIDRMRQHMGRLQCEIEKLIHVPVSQRQFDALTVLAYNVGIGALEHSHLLKRINQLDAKAPEEFLDWCYVTNPETHLKEISAGLEKRRKQEHALFCSDPFPFSKAA